MLKKTLTLLLISAISVSGSNITLLKAYDAKTCKNEPSCDLVDDPTLPADRRTLRKRPCMCDAKCVLYRDCCTDSKYYNELEQSRPPPFYCQSTYKVYMKATCPETWADEEIRLKCTLSTSALRCEDTSLIVPVTNTAENMTYGNKYCAQCHGDTNYQAWTLTPSCGEAPNGFLNHLSTTPTFTESVSTVNPTTLTRQLRSLKKVNPHKKIHRHRGAVGSAYITSLLRYMRRKRETKFEVDFYKYIRIVNDIWKTARYDSHTGFFVTKYSDRDMICSVAAKLSRHLKRHVRSCVPDIIETCKQFDSDADDKQCRNHTSLVFNKRNNKAYRNKHCAKCDGAELNYLTGCPIIVRDEIPKKFFISLL